MILSHEADAHCIALSASKKKGGGMQRARVVSPSMIIV
jgi:hypothetical protein